MTVFIETDLEGISGVSTIDMVANSDPRALERLMADTNAAVRGAFAGGADRVLVLDHGKVAQFGTPAELSAQPGLYQQIEEIQSYHSDDIDRGADSLHPENSEQKNDAVDLHPEKSDSNIELHPEKMTLESEVNA